MALTKIKTEEIAAIFIEGIVLVKCKIGERKIPPPIPTKPETKPISALIMLNRKIPILEFTDFEKFSISSFLINKRIPDIKIIIPKISAILLIAKLSNKLADFLISIFMNQFSHFVSSNFCC